MRSYVLAVALSFAAACGSSPGHGSGGALGCPSGDDGLALLSWTVRGMPPSETACAPYDHLTLLYESDNCAGVEISPINCAMDRWPSQPLPQGPGTATLYAIDSTHQIQLTGSTRLVLTSTRPSMPTNIDLR
jgi:hypothetical protein